MSQAKAPKGHGLQAYVLSSKQAVVTRLRDAMKVIEREIEAADGIYPLGKLTQRELCERAGVKQATLQKPTHRETTLVEVNGWLARVAESMRTSKQVHKVVTDRIEGLKQRNADLMQRYHESELELIDAKDRIAKLEAQIASLTTNDRSRVTSIKVAQARRGTRQ